VKAYMCAPPVGLVRASSVASCFLVRNGLPSLPSLPLPTPSLSSSQVLNYHVTEKYSAHFDYFHDSVNVANGGQRLATMLMYLSDVEEGGETVFPASKAHSNDSSQLSSCGKQGLAVKPKKGNALLFYSLKPDGTQASQRPALLVPWLQTASLTRRWMHAGFIELA
jgi:prolyl 4-hydroxylase